MFVACSTLCFARMPLEAALRHLIELEFNKVDLAIHESGPHLRPSQVADEFDSVLHQLRGGPSLTISSLDLKFDAPDAQALQAQFAAMCRLAKSLMVAVLTIPAAPRDTSFDAEVARLSSLGQRAQAEGLVLSVLTDSSALTWEPKVAQALCQAVPGLGLTLDPSHFINGPYQSDAFDELYPFVQNVHFRDTGRKPGDFQVRVGQGEIEYGKVIAQLERHGYDRGLTVAIDDRHDNPFDIELEVRKLKLLLESLV